MEYRLVARGRGYFGGMAFYLDVGKPLLSHDWGWHLFVKRMKDALMGAHARVGGESGVAHPNVIQETELQVRCPTHGWAGINDDMECVKCWERQHRQAHILIMNSPHFKVAQDAWKHCPGPTARDITENMIDLLAQSKGISNYQVEAIFERELETDPVLPSDADSHGYICTVCGEVGPHVCQP